MILQVYFCLIDLAVSRILRYLKMLILVGPNSKVNNHLKCVLECVDWISRCDVLEYFRE